MLDYDAQLLVGWSMNGFVALLIAFNLFFVFKFGAHQIWLVLQKYCKLMKPKYKKSKDKFLNNKVKKSIASRTNDIDLKAAVAEDQAEII